MHFLQYLIGNALEIQQQQKLNKPKVTKENSVVYVLFEKAHTEHIHCIERRDEDDDL